MRCENCPALRIEGYEYPESYCCIYPDEETVEFPNGDLGCRHQLATIKKKIDELDKAMSKQYEGIGEWYMKEQEKEKAITEALYCSFEKQDVIAAQKDVNGRIHFYTMDKRADGVISNIAIEMLYILDKLGYEIIKKEKEK